MERTGILEKVKVPPDLPIEHALEKMDRAARQILLVTDEGGHLLGTITDGDVRRALLGGVNLREPVARIMNRNPKILPSGSSPEAARQLMVEHSIRHIPLVDKMGRVVELLAWKELFLSVAEHHLERVVIMAGGQGTRLDPFTRILPKPMIPIRDKPIIEVIIEKFYRQGFSQFNLCLGYKAEIIRLYFNGDSRPYHIDFVQEDTPLGTAGALSLLTGSLDETFILTNCDIIVELDYAHLLQYHRERENTVTIVGALKEFVVPYGVLRTEDNTFRIEEKPNFHFLVNTGLYVLEPAVLNMVKEEKRLDMPELIQAVQEKELRIGVYPHHGRWFDTGQWDEYQQTIKFFETMGLGG
ncbi:MAG: nucleotidyltransferase family protein [Bacillota bacterium]